MIHARRDYMHIQDNTGKIAEDEPVFLLRAKDELAPAVMQFWVDRLCIREREGDTVTVKAVQKHIDLMKEWQKKNGCKTPDTPAEVVSI